MSAANRSITVSKEKVRSSLSIYSGRSGAGARQAVRCVTPRAHARNRCCPAALASPLLNSTLFHPRNATAQPPRRCPTRPATAALPRGAPAAHLIGQGEELLQQLRHQRAQRVQVLLLHLWQSKEQSRHCRMRK